MSWRGAAFAPESNPFKKQAGQDLDRSLLIWRACLTVPHSLAILSAIYRLYRRTKTRQLWRDDYFAAITLVLECLYFPTLWLAECARPKALIVTSWIAQVVCPLLIWFTRVSLSFSIARVIPPKQPMRLTSICFAWACGVMGTGIAVVSLITCGRNNHNWDQTYPYQCPMPIASGIFRTCTDIGSDIILIVIPFWAFWRRLKLPRVTRRLIKACFAASVLTFLSCVATAAVLLKLYNSNSAQKKAQTGFLASVMSHLMASTALLVCNILVVVTSVYRFFRNENAVLRVRGNGQPPPASPAAQTTTDADPSNNPSNSNTDVRRTATTPIDTIPRRSVSLTNSSVTSRIEFELTEIFDSDSSQMQTGAVQFVESSSWEISRPPDDGNIVAANKFGQRY